MRKILFFCLWLGVVAWVSGVETLTLTDGATLSGEIIKSDDNGMMLRLPGEVYAATNVVWSHLSQASLKHLAAYPKIKPFVEVFIEPDATQRPLKPEIQVKEVTRLAKPENPSIFGGLFQSWLGRFILLVLYAANLFAAYEISIVRVRPALQVIGLAAVLPVIGPIIFLAMPMLVDAPPPDAPVETDVDVMVQAGPTAEEFQPVDASWRHEEKTAEAQVFMRGKFIFNRRFVETKFAGFIGAPKGDALKFAMTVKTPQDEFAVKYIAQVGQTDAMLETPLGQVSVAFSDIQEIRLNPKTA